MDLNALIQELQEHDIQLWLEHDMLRFSAPKGAMSEMLRQKIIEQKPELVKLLINQLGLPKPIRHKNKDALIPASPSQQRLWFLEQVNPSSNALHISSLIEISGNMDIKQLQNCIDTIFQHHSVLHCSYQQQGNGIFQKVEAISNAEIDILHGHFTIDHVKQYIHRNPPQFNLSLGELFNCKIFELKKNHYALFFAVHHIACDGLSIQILADEIFKLYLNQYEITNNNDSLDYFDHSFWQKSIEQHPKLKQETVYWKNKLSDIEALSLPTDYPRPSVASNNGSSFYQRFPFDSSLAIQGKIKTYKTTPFNFFLAAFSATLRHYSQQTNFAIGIAVNGRIDPAFEKTVGCFINVLPIKVEFTETLNFLELHQQIKGNCYEAYDHQSISFDRLVNAINPQRNMSSTPIFQTFFSLQKSHSQQQNHQELKIKPVALEKDCSQYELSLFVNEDSDGSFIFEWVYNTDLFTQNRIEHLAASFKALAESVIDNDLQNIDAIALASAHTINNYQKQWQHSFDDFGKFSRIEQLVSQQCEMSSRLTALSQGDSSISYEELEQMSNALAFKLVKYRHPLIGVHLERSIEQCIVLLAVLKAGKAYIPLDSSTPEKRLQNIISDAKPEIIISSKKLAVPNNIATTLFIEDLTIYTKSKEKPQVNQPSDIFNTIYTSGSTGNPKGVVIPQQAIFNRLTWMQKAFQIQRGEKVLHKTSFSFDVSVWEIFWPLINGGEVVIAHKDGNKNPSYLAALINRKNIQYCHFVPSMLSVFLDEPSSIDCTSLKSVICSGESLKKQQVQHFYSVLPDCHLYNLYGPTEAAIDVSWHKCLLSEKHIPLGKAISNTQLQLLNNQNTLVPEGAIGEITIGGQNLAVGYLNNPELTGQSFIQNPLHVYGHPSPRLYKTGDLGFFDNDGNLHFAGRIDDQIKIRGFRVELRDIENAVLQHPAINDAFIRAIANQNNDVRLVAYYMTNNDNITAEQLKPFLSSRLPRYMIPSHFICVDEWPVKENGKKLITALPLPEDIKVTQTNFVAPRNNTEKQLQKIWQELLAVEHISIYDNFFELGGHSLLAVQALHLGQQHFNVNIQLTDLLQAPNIATAAKLIEQALKQQSILSQHDHGNNDEEIIL